MARPDLGETNPTIFTLIVHGTFAEDETWWRLAKGSNPTFADRLESALAQRGIVNTVWQPALKEGIDYSAFTWSGTNLHKDRKAGARMLRSSLKELADKIGATIKKPLIVNFVAHSHGGNIVLEALKRLDPRIQVNRVALLGTPLISFRPSLRLIRIIVSYLLLFIITLFGSYALMQLGSLIVVQEFINVEGGSAAQMLILVLPVIAFYGWIFWFIAFLADQLWRVLCSPILWLRGRWNGQAYGLSARKLSKRLGNKKIILFTSHQDEADLLLKLGSAPRRLYVETINLKWKTIPKILERIFLRPIIVDLFLRVIEIILERYALGFSWLSVLFFDYEMADLKRGKEYPSSIFERKDVSDYLLPILRTKEIRAIHSEIYESEEKALKGVERHVATLRESLKAVIGDITSQIKLRHSLYYENEEVLERLADALKS